MIAILTITTPIFMIMALGYGVVRFNIFTRDQLSSMGKFVIQIGLPMLVFNAIATRPLTDVLNITYLLGYGLASGLAFLIGWLISKKRKLSPTLSALNALATSMSNTGFIGYPLLVLTIGAPAAIFFAMNVLVENLLILPLMFILIDAGTGSSNILVLSKKIIKTLGKNPIIISLIISMVISIFRIPIPEVVEKVNAMMSSAASPLALFVIGGSLSGLKIKGDLTDVFLVTIGKLIIFPTLVVLCLWILKADIKTIFAGALLSSVPMASMYPIFGLKYGHEKQTSTAILITTLFSFFSISLVLMVGQ